MTPEELERILLNPATIVTGATLAGLFACTNRTVTDLAKREVVVRVGRGRYQLRASLENYVSELREKAAGRQDGELSEGGSTRNERHRLTTARANLAELELAERVGAVIPTRAAVGLVSQAISNMKNRLLAIPTKAAPQLLKLTDARDARAILEQEIEQALAELSTLNTLSVPGGELLDEAGGSLSGSGAVLSRNALA